MGRGLRGTGGRSSVKNNNNGECRWSASTSTGCPEWKRLCAKSIPDGGAGRRAEVGRCVGLCALVVWSLFSWHLRSHLYGRVSLFSAGWGREERIGEALPDGPDWTGALSAPPTLSCSTSSPEPAHTQTHTRPERSLPLQCTDTVTTKFLILGYLSTIFHACIEISPSLIRRHSCANGFIFPYFPHCSFIGLEKNHTNFRNQNDHVTQHYDWQTKL